MAFGAFRSVMIPENTSLRASSRLPPSLLFLAIFAFACTLRITYFAFVPNTLNGEGINYARTAENLVHGHGYVNFALEGRDLMFPPAYPLLIAMASFFTHDFYTGARLVSFAAGVLLLLPLFGITRDLYGRNVAYVAIAIAATHPVLIDLSVTAWVEGLYLTLIATSIYFVNRCHDHAKMHYWGLSGAFLGLAYLACPQAIVLPFILLASLYLLTPSSVTLRRLALFAGSFLVFAVPYVVFLSTSTGQLRVEGKTIVNNELGRSILSGVPYSVAGYEVTEDLQERGVWMRPNADVAKESKALGYRNTFRIMARGLANLKQVLLDVSSHPVFGGPFILLFVVLGLFSSAWTPPRARREVILIVTFAASVVPMTTIIHTFASRYYYVLIPFLIVWAAHGIQELTRWTRATIVTLGIPHLPPRISGTAVGGLALLSLISIFAVGASYMAHVEPWAVELKRAGEWLATVPGEKTIMDTNMDTAFRAAAKYVPLPWSNADTALRYADMKGVNFIVVKSWDLDARPYLRDWLSSGIPGSNTTLVNTFGNESSGRVLIFARH